MNLTGQVAVAQAHAQFKPEMRIDVVRDENARLREVAAALLQALVTVEKIAGANVSDQQREITDAIIFTARAAIEKAPA